MYTDSLAQGWVDGSWAPHNFASTDVVYSGLKSVYFHPDGSSVSLLFSL